MLAAPIEQTSTLRQVGRFSVVGFSSTVVHVLTALAVNAGFGLSPLWANFVAFLIATAFSYFGNWFWTFDAVSRHGFAVPRFLAVALLGFLVNHAIVFAVTGLANQPLWVAMIPVVLTVPALSFWLSKTRVFLSARATGARV